MNPSKLEEIPRLLDQMGVDYDFYFIDLNTQESFHRSTTQKLPFASCYKLGILGAVLDDPLIATALDKPIVLTDSKINRLASGVLQSLEFPVRFSVRNLLKIMMSQSDGTAADFLSELVGFDKISSYISENTRASRLSHNIEGLVNRLIDEAKRISIGDQVTRTDYLIALRETTANEDFTCAEDLTLLLRKLVDSGPVHLQFLKQAQANPRSAMYCPLDVQIYGKTGTLGFWASVNDCGILCSNEETRAAFGLATLGWTKPRFVIEHCFGEIGRMMCSLYSSDEYSPSYGP